MNSCLELKGAGKTDLKKMWHNSQHYGNEDQITLAESISEQLSLTLENIRLLEDAQRRAYTEQTIGEISARIGSFTETEAILRTTVDEIGKTIRGAKVVFELEEQEDEDDQWSNT